MRRLLVASPFFAALALASTGWGLAREGGYGWSDATRLIFDSAAHLAFEPPEVGQKVFSSWQIQVARLCVVLFGLTTGLGLVLAVFRSASDATVSATFWFRRKFLDRPTAVIIGIGSVLEHVLAELSTDGPLYAIDVASEGRAVDKARAHGALVITGDATELGTRGRPDLINARRVFIATGDDTRNLAIAAAVAQEAAGRSHHRPSENPLTIYVHSQETARSATTEGHSLLRGRVPGVEIVPFSTTDLVARELFFAHPDGLLVSTQTVPRADEVFHVCLFGFDGTAQAIALHVARFAHFVSRIRPRLTIYDDAHALEDSTRRFLERHPGFAPPDLDLSSQSFTACGDGWDARPGHPAARDYHRKALEVIADDDVTREVHPVEYAVNAEFLSCPSDCSAAQLADELRVRLLPPRGKVRGAVVICFGDSRRNFSCGLEIRDALARRLLQDPRDELMAQGQPPVLPIHIYLPDHASLADLLHDQTGSEPHGVQVRRAFPFHVFGQSKDVISVATITRGPSRDPAGEIRSAYEILAAHGAALHPDFDDSNLDAALHAESLKFEAVGLVFRDATDREQTAQHADGFFTPLLESLLHDDVSRAAKALFASGRIHEDGRLEIAPDKLLELTPPVRQRLAVLDDIHIPRSSLSETVPEVPHCAALRRIAKESIAEVVRQLADELRQRGQDLDLVAEMEHNRWMGERLAKGWSFGPRSDVRRQRPSFVPWQDLTESERDVDRAQFARLIVGRGADGKHAYISPHTTSTAGACLQEPT